MGSCNHAAERRQERSQAQRTELNRRISDNTLHNKLWTSVWCGLGKEALGDKEPMTINTQAIGIPKSNHFSCQFLMRTLLNMQLSPALHQVPVVLILLGYDHMHSSPTTNLVYFGSSVRPCLKHCPTLWTRTSPTRASDLHNMIYGSLTLQ